jgi:hypothetical protein
MSVRAASRTQTARRAEPVTCLWGAASLLTIIVTGIVIVQLRFGGFGPSYTIASPSMVDCSASGTTRKDK